MKMHENSLFAILLRSQWWVSALAGAALIGLLRLVIPDIYAFFAGLPFVIIAIVVAWRELRQPSGKKIGQALERVRAMSWDEFARELENAYGSEGYSVSRIASGPADLELERNGRTTLVACKRWKAGRTGTDALRELEAARKKRNAYECIFVAAGEISDQARIFARDTNIKLLEGAELAKKIGLRKKRWP